MPKWTEEEIALLGTDTDAAIAKRVGRQLTAVTNKRLEMGVPASQGRAYEWTDDEIALLGTAKDADVADQLGVSRKTVVNKRAELGIPTYRSQRASGSS